MQILQIDRNNIADFRLLIKDEIFYELNKKRVFACGAVFLGGPQGVAVWEEEEQTARLLYIYVTEECRHMELGTQLVRYIAVTLQKKGIEELSCEYSEQDNREALTGLFESLGAQLDGYTCPYGSVTFERILEKAGQEKFDKVRERAVPMHTLSPSQKKEIADVVMEETGQELYGYLDCDLSVALFGSGGLLGFALARQEGNVFHLDYCYSLSSPVAIAGVFAGICDVVKNMTPEKRVLDMVLYNPAAEKLYERFSKDIATIRLVYVTMDTQMIAVDALIDSAM